MQDMHFRDSFLYSWNYRQMLKTILATLYREVGIPDAHLLYQPVSMDGTLSHGIPSCSQGPSPLANRTISLSLSGDEDSIQ